MKPKLILTDQTHFGSGWSRGNVGRDVAPCIVHSSTSLGIQSSLFPCHSSTRFHGMGQLGGGAG